MPRILVLNRMHLDEWPADQVARTLASLNGQRMITSFSREAPRAGGKPQRGYDGNITESSPGRPRGNREQRDAWQITQLAQKAELTLDIHGTMNKGWDFPFYGAAGRSRPLITGVASLLGCARAAILDAPHPAGVLQNYVGWDLSTDTAVLSSLGTWLSDLAHGWIPPARPMAEYRIIGGILKEHAFRVGLKREYPPFARLPDQAIRTLGLPIPAYAFSWSANLYSHTGYWGEVAVPYRNRSRMQQDSEL